MRKRTQLPFFIPYSDNRKSAIQNLKWLGLLALLVGWGMAHAQQPGKIPRIGCAILFALCTTIAQSLRGVRKFSEGSPRRRRGRRVNKEFVIKILRSLRTPRLCGEISFPSLVAASPRCALCG